MHMAFNHVVVGLVPIDGANFVKVFFYKIANNDGIRTRVQLSRTIVVDIVGTFSDT